MILWRIVKSKQFSYWSYERHPCRDIFLNVPQIDFGRVIEDIVGLVMITCHEPWAAMSNGLFLDYNYDWPPFWDWLETGEGIHQRAFETSMSARIAQLTFDGHGVRLGEIWFEARKQ